MVVVPPPLAQLLANSIQAGTVLGPQSPSQIIATESAYDLETKLLS